MNRRNAAIASVVSVCLVISIWAAIRPEEFFALVQEINWEYIKSIVLLFGCINLIPDYISLSETRIVLDLIRKSTSKLAVIGLLLLDAGLTIAIAAFSITLIYFLLFGDSISSILSGLWSHGFKLSAFDKGDGTHGWFLYSTFFTSVWIWLYLFSGAVVRTYTFLINKMGRTVSLLDISGKPFRSLGVVGIIVVTFIFCIAPIVRFIF